MIDHYVHVVTTMQSEARSADRFAAIMRRLVHSARAADGNHRFDAYQGVSAPHEFVVVEAWEDEQAADGHIAADYVEQTFVAMGPLLAAPSGITRYVRIA